MADGGDLIARVQAERDAARSNALGPLREAAGRRASDQERAVRLAADNLLDKALRRLRDGDEAAARTAVARALRLGDGDEGPLAVHLFVWDALREAALGEGHDDWLDRAQAVPLEGPARREWLAALRALEGEGELDRADARRIRGFAGGTASAHEPFAGVDEAARIEATTAVMQALLRVVG
jgi:hypothetical protein